MICTFFGHRDTPKEIESTLKLTLLDLIENHNVNLFYVGNKGNFDSLVYNQLIELSKKHRIKYFVVLDRFPNKSDSTFYSNTILPEGIENVPPRFAISYRNKWMLKQSDIVVTYVSYISAGAYKFKELAEKQGKIVINLKR